MISGGLNPKANKPFRILVRAAVPSLAGVLCLFFILSVPAAHGNQLVISSRMQLEYAMQNFEDKDYETALVEFKRFEHFFPDDPRAPEAKFYTGLCFFHLKRYQQAAKVFNDIIMDPPDSDFKSESYFYQSRAFRQMGNSGYAKLVLLNYLKLSNTADIKDKIYCALADLYIADFTTSDRQPLLDARQQLMKISPANAGLYKKNQRIARIDAALKAPQKSPAAAGFFSIIPGGGFFYCERYQDSLVAFLLNSALIFAAYEAFDQDNNALGALISFVETGFYTGNIYGSISAAHQYNRLATLRVLNRKLDVFSKADIKNKGLMIGLQYRF